MNVQFEHPPIHEAVLSAQFAPLHRMTAAHVGAIWGRFRSRFPNIEEHDPIANIIETFDETPPRPQVQFLLGRGQPPRRTWLVASGGHELIQIQPDRFVRNWRRVEDQGDYPGFSVVRQEFANDLEVFEGVIADEDLGGIEYDQCEHTYIDLIADGFSGHEDVGAIIRGLTWPPLPEGLAAEHLTTQSDFILRERDRLLARFHFNVNPARRIRDGKPLLRIETTARGRPLGPGRAGVLAFMDRVHQPVLDLFLAMTTPEIQAHWGLKRDV